MFNCWLRQHRKCVVNDFSQPPIQSTILSCSLRSFCFSIHTLKWQWVASAVLNFYDTFRYFCVAMPNASVRNTCTQTLT